MSGNVWFQMDESERQDLIYKHLFYVTQAHKRLLSQFDDINAEAEKVAEEWLKESELHFDPEGHDPSDFCEAAHDEAVKFYVLLSDMLEQARLSVVAGMFHEWNKAVRELLVREIQHRCCGEAVARAVWKEDFEKIAALLDSIGWKFSSADYFRALDACRLVVNVYKHGDGSSLNHLKNKFPEYLDHPFRGLDCKYSDIKYCDQSNLRASKEQLQAFSDAIVDFWKAAPERVLISEVDDLPDWFNKAIEKDCKSSAQAKAL